MAPERPWVEIRELVLRIPGLEQFEARRLAEDVARSLAEELARRPAQAARRVDVLNLQVAAGTLPHELARLIARHIREEMS
jgi:hypothetical protein